MILLASMIGATRFHHFFCFLWAMAAWPSSALQPSPTRYAPLVAVRRAPAFETCECQFMHFKLNVNLHPSLLVNTFFMQHTVLPGTCGFGERIADNFPLPAQMGMVHTLVCCIRHLWIGKLISGRLWNFKSFL